MSISARRLFRHSGVLLFATGLLRGTSTLLFLLISRRFGAADAGVYSLCTTYLALFTAISLWGLDELLVRQVAQDHGVGSKFLLNFVALRVCIMTLAYGVLFVLITRLLPYSGRVSAIIAIFGISLLPEGISLLSQAVLSAYERFELVAVLLITTAAIRLLLGLAVLLLPLPFGLMDRLMALVLVLVGISCGAAVMNGALAIFALRRDSRGPSSKLRLDLTFCLEYLRQTSPLIVTGVALAVEQQTDVILLSVWGTVQQVGYYTAAMTVVVALWLIPQAYQFVIYPVMSRVYLQDRPGLEKLFDQALRFTSLAGLGIGGLVVLFAPLLPIAFGASFEAAVIPLRWLAVPIIFAFLNAPTSRLMLASNHLRPLPLTIVGSMMVTVALELLLIPRFGMTGAAMARAASSGIFFIATGLFLYRHVCRFDLRILAQLALAGAGLLVLFALMQFVAFPLQLVLGVSGMLALFIVTGLLKIPDMRSVGSRE